MEDNMKKFVSIILASTVIISAFTLAACKDNKEQDSSIEQNNNNSESSLQSVVEISVEPSKPEISAEQISQLGSDISSYEKVPVFACESEKIDAEKISQDKVLELITENKDDEFCALISKQFINAAKSAGFKNAVSSNTDGTPAAFNNALDTAVKSKYSAVMMFGNIVKDSISSAIERTQANGIKVLSAGNKGIGQDDHYVDNTVPINYQLVGKLLADWTIVKQSGKVNALAINCSDSGISNAVYQGFEEEFKKYVYSGYCTTLNIASIEIGNGLSNRIKTALKDDPNINYVIVFSDSMINDTVSAIEQSGASVKTIATGGSPSAFDFAKNDHIEMLVAQSYEWTAYAMVDYALRVISKSELPKEQYVPVRIVTPESIKKGIDEYNQNYNDKINGFHEICFGSSFVSGYSNLWMLG